MVINALLRCRKVERGRQIQGLERSRTNLVLISIVNLPWLLYEYVIEREDEHFYLFIQIQMIIVSAHEIWRFMQVMFAFALCNCFTRDWADRTLLLMWPHSRYDYYSMCSHAKTESVRPPIRYGLNRVSSMLSRAVNQVAFSMPSQCRSLQEPSFTSLMSSK